MANSTWINGLTNDYKVIDGIIQSNNYLLTEAYTRIITPYASYYFDSTFGSYLTIWINTRKIITVDEATSEIVRCLQIITEQQRAKSISVKVTKLLTNAIFFSVTITDNSNQTFTLNSNYVSV